MLLSNADPALRALILVGYETGLRLGDLLRLPTVDRNGRFSIVQSKTGDVITCQLSAEAVDAVRLGGEVFSWPRRRIQERFTALLVRCGLSGSIKRLRATGATWCEVTEPGSAAAYLGHKTPGLALKHYIDPRHLSRTKPLPPPLYGRSD